jgi:excinuclease UvrABC nuclease subunit
VQSVASASLCLAVLKIWRKQRGFNACIAYLYVLFTRHGKMLGSRSYFPKVPGSTEIGEVVHAVFSQFYLQGS